VCDQETSKYEEAKARYRAEENTTTMGCNARKTNKHVVEVLCLCGFKSLLINKHNRLMLPKCAHLAVPTTGNSYELKQNMVAAECMLQLAFQYTTVSRAEVWDVGGRGREEEEPVVGSNAYCKM
jgi:hypothetical protein